HKLNAPDGLTPGFHLTIRLDPDGEAGGRQHACLDEARGEAFARFNEEHGSSYDDATVRCLDGSALFCDAVEVPDDQQLARGLAEVLRAAELERGCLELAPMLEYVRDPGDKRIEVKMRTAQPDWFPTVPPDLPPLPGIEEVACE